MPLILFLLQFACQKRLNRPCCWVYPACEGGAAPGLSCSIGLQGTAGDLIREACGLIFAWGFVVCLMQAVSKPNVLSLLMCSSSVFTTTNLIFLSASASGLHTDSKTNASIRSRIQGSCTGQLGLHTMVVYWYVIQFADKLGWTKINWPPYRLCN